MSEVTIIHCVSSFKTNHFEHYDVTCSEEFVCRKRIYKHQIDKINLLAEEIIKNKRNTPSVRFCACCLHLLKMPLESNIYACQSQQKHICNGCYESKFTKDRGMVPFQNDICTFCDKEMDFLVGCYLAWAESCDSERYYKFSCNECTMKEYK